MRAEIIAVGTELLLGDAVDENSAWLSARLAEIGVDVHRHTTVGDNVARITAVIAAASETADAVVVTGGLGPTQDDVTRHAVAEVAGAGLERREDLVAYLRDYFEGRGRVMPETNLVQADIPMGAEILPPVGSAAGFAVELPKRSGAAGERTSCVVYCLPGVPAEMRTMFDRDVLDDLQARGGLATTVSRTIQTAGMAESDVAARCAPVVERLDAGDADVTVAFLASRAETRVRVTAKAPSREAALARLQPVVDELVHLLGAGVVGLDGEGVEELVARQLLGAGWTLAVAESVTGGGVGARLVRVAGASDWFRGGLVTYATGAKQTLAGIPDHVLAHGPVSEEVAGALAAAAQQRLGADVGLGVVGVAGPTTQAERDIGTICLGVALPHGGIHTRTVRLPGRTRGEVQDFAASIALDYLRRRLAGALS